VFTAELTIDDVEVLESGMVGVCCADAEAIEPSENKNMRRHNGALKNEII
jgi:hypothetical protein